MVELKTALELRSLREELASSRAELVSSRHQLASSTSELENAKKELAFLRHNLDVLKRMLFGPRSERRAGDVPAPDQSLLALGEVVAQAERVAKEEGSVATVEVASNGEPVKSRRKRSVRRSQFPEHLPVLRTTFDLREAEKVCACGSTLSPMGEETSKELERIEVTLVHEIVRKKYACPCCRENVVVAKGPARVIDKGLLGVGFLAHVLTERFRHHMPYHRLESKYASEGLTLSRSILCRSSIRCASLLEPLYDEIKRQVLASDVVGTDDTGVSVQAKSDGSSGKGHFWLYRDLLGRSVFHFTENRSRDGPKKMLEGFRGYLQADAYPAYDAFFRDGEIVEVGCWAHARRKFVDAEPTDPTLSKEAIERIRALYDVEALAKGRSPQERKRLRAEKSAALLEDLFSWMDAARATVLDQSPLGTAIDYATKNRVALSRFLEDGRLEIDNNAVERGLRRVAVGRKNFVNVGNEEGGNAAAILFSLVATCEEAGVNVREYFQDVLLRIATCSDASKLTPHGWKANFEALVHAERAKALERVVIAAR